MHKLVCFLLVPGLLLLTGCGDKAEGSEPAQSTQQAAGHDEHDGHEHAEHSHLPGPVEAATSKEFTIIDVRTPAEFKAGHLAQAKNIDVKAADFDNQVSALPKDGKYVVYCQSGARSSIAAARMTSAGYGSVVDGGGMQELVNAGVPKA